MIRLPHYLLLFVLSCCWVFVPLVRGKQGTCEGFCPGTISAEQFALEGEDPDDCLHCLSSLRGSGRRRGLSRCAKEGFGGPV